MSTMRLTDDAIRNALQIGPEVTAPFELAWDIRRAIDATPQRRTPRWIGGAPRSMVRLVVLALIALALIGAILIVGSLLRQPRPPAAVLSFHGGPARTGVMPGPGPAGSPIACWPPVTLTGQTSTFVEPAIVAGTIYVGDSNGIISAIDEATGRLRWQSEPKVGPIYSSPAVTGTVLAIGSDDGNLYVFDRRTGALLWRYQAGGPVRSPPTIVDNVAYFGSDDGRLYAIDLATHEPRWPPRQTGGPIDRAVSIADGLIFAGSGSTSDATFDAYDVATGRPAWSTPQHLGAGQVSTSSVAGGRVYVAGGLDVSRPPHRLFAFDERTGRPAWASPFAVPSRVNVFVAAVAGGTVYVASYDKSVYALDAATGHPVWSGPFVANGQIGSVGAIADGTLYVVSDDGNLYAIDAATGTERWRTKAGGESAAPVVIDGRVILATSLGQIVCVAGSASPSTTP